MNASQYFRPTYAAARERSHRRRAWAEVESHRNPTKGAEGEELTTDVAVLGPAMRPLLIVVSARMARKVFAAPASRSAGSPQPPLPADTAILFVHAINPYGFSHVRRVTEDNVDLNRNFVDHGNAKPANPGYDTLRDFICPKEWTEESERKNLAALHAYASEHGVDALETAIASGQYVDPQGVFYGGTQPTWSNRTLRAILKPFARPRGTSPSSTCTPASGPTASARSCPTTPRAIPATRSCSAGGAAKRPTSTTAPHHPITWSATRRSP
jgi:hypothetical protein